MKVERASRLCFVSKIHLGKFVQDTYLNKTGLQVSTTANENMNVIEYYN